MTDLPDTVVILRSEGDVISPIPEPVPVDMAAAIAAVASYASNAAASAAAAAAAAGAVSPSSSLALSTVIPQPLGTATPGLSEAASRSDHVHAMPNKADIGLGNVVNIDATDRANHTGSQSISTIYGLQDALDAANGGTSYTASDMLDMIKTVDGSGSGLDADTVHGTTPTPFGLDRISDIDAAAAHIGLGLGSAALLNAGSSAGDLVALAGAGLLPALDGSQLTGMPHIDYQFFTASGTWTKPTNLSGNALVVGLLWGAGGGGGTNSGGGGGSCIIFIKRASDLGATETVTIGGGGTAGAVGGNSSFGGVTAYGGGAGTGSVGGAGAGWDGIGGLFSGVGASQAGSGIAGNGSFGGGGGGSGIASTYYSGGRSTFGGAGGASASGVSAAASIFGGNGGSSGVAAQVPGGGGYLNSAGAGGKLQVWTIG